MNKMHHLHKPVNNWLNYFACKLMQCLSVTIGVYDHCCWYCSSCWHKCCNLYDTSLCAFFDVVKNQPFVFGCSRVSVYLVKPKKRHKYCLWELL